MPKQGAMEFSPEELARATRPSVELISDALAAEAFEAAKSLVEQLHTEVCSMLYGYLSWPRCIARNVQDWQNEAYWQEMDTGVRRELPDDPPRARDVFGKWGGLRDALHSAAESGDKQAVLEGARRWHSHALAVHDSYMNYAALLVSELARRFGPDAMQQVLTEIMDPQAMNMSPDTPFRQRVETLIGFTRLHLLPFQLVEDHEKMTFIATPCPSGGRQVLAGLYNGNGRGEIIRGPSATTYGLTELPAYCCHESALEAASIRQLGSPLFVVDPATQLGEKPCHVHVYKKAANIPEHYYRRVGLQRDADLIATD